MASWLGAELYRSLVAAVVLGMVLNLLPAGSGRVFAAPQQTIALTAAAVSSSQIRLDWSIANPGAIASVRIFRATADAPQNFVFITTVSSGTRSFVDQGLAAASLYLYMVRTVAPGGVLMSTPSNTASMRTLNAAGATPTPTATRSSRRWNTRPWA